MKLRNVSYGAERIQRFTAETTAHKQHYCSAALQNDANHSKALRTDCVRLRAGLNQALSPPSVSFVVAESGPSSELLAVDSGTDRCNRSDVVVACNVMSTTVAPQMHTATGY
jgi:hypothetical protein